MDYGQVTSIDEERLIRSIADDYKGPEDDIHNLLESLVQKAYNQGKQAGFDDGFFDGVREGENNEFERRERMRHGLA